MSTNLSEDEVDVLLQAAVLAPSMHNTQPWRFEVIGPVVDVRLDADRTLPVADPAGRLVRIGLGAAAFNVRVAAAMLGYETTLALAPDPARPDVVARIFLAEHQPAAPTLARLYGELPRRRTYRGPMLDLQVPPRLLTVLADSVQAEGAQLQWIDRAQRSLLGGILHEADDLELHSEDHLHERLRWVGGDRAAEGIPEPALGPLPTRGGTVRNLAAGLDTPHRARTVFEEQPVVAVLSTRGEDESAWLRAGLALEHLLLTATSYDLAASFLNQALEFPGTRFKVHELIGCRTWPQTIIRLGYPAHPGDRTPRRPVAAQTEPWHN
ncbi:nitroreductase family protein [Kribbella amoyensis]|uniref:Nitroreductase family protein n=1 Tax=Kribbella amoyensis TaxID=996641 RepID=A0A561BS87_9ACTN|nr:nitroreductase family protein [Kribbella amoyensis]TWD81757.1 nitroreductase family protein [Kribbella amoyensis]